MGRKDSSKKRQPRKKTKKKVAKQTQPLRFEISLSDIVTSTDITPGTGSLVTTGANPTVELSPEQRSFLKRMLEEIYRFRPFVEFGVEVSPDGTMRGYIRPRA